MSWLKKIIGKLNTQEAEQAAEKLIDAMPATACMTAQVPEPDEVDPDNPFKQRRYFVKQGRFVDYQDQNLKASGSGDEADEIRDRPPVDLKTMFPRLSLR